MCRRPAALTWTVDVCAARLRFTLTSRVHQGGLPNRYASLQGGRLKSAGGMKKILNPIAGFSGPTRQVIERFGFEQEIEKLDKADRLYQSSRASAKATCAPAWCPTPKWALSYRS